MLIDDPTRPVVNFDIQCKLIWYMQPPLLFKFARLHRQLYYYFLAIRSLLFDINHVLSPFFANPTEFRVLQAYTGLLISGSMALQFLNRCTFGETDLDLYVEQHSAYVVIDWLTNHGYSMIPRRRQGRNVRSMFSVRELRDPAVRGGYSHRPGQVCIQFNGVFSKRKIDLIVTRDTVLSSILDFHSSERSSSP